MTDSTNTPSGRTRKSTVRKSRKNPMDEDLGPARVWVSVGLNMQIAPYNSVSPSFGFSMTSPSDDIGAILKMEEEMYAVCEQVVERRFRKLARLARTIAQEEGLDPEVWDIEDEEDDDDWDE